jgi:hypothetical protein
MKIGKKIISFRRERAIKKKDIAESLTKYIEDEKELTEKDKKIIEKKVCKPKELKKLILGEEAPDIIAEIDTPSGIKTIKVKPTTSGEIFWKPSRYSCNRRWKINLQELRPIVIRGRTYLKGYFNEENEFQYNFEEGRELIDAIRSGNKDKLDALRGRALKAGVKIGEDTVDEPIRIQKRREWRTREEAEKSTVQDFIKLALAVVIVALVVLSIFVIRSDKSRKEEMDIILATIIKESELRTTEQNQCCPMCLGCEGCLTGIQNLLMQCQAGAV